MKIYIVLTLLLVSLNASILFLGSSDAKFICDGKDYSPTEILNCSKIEAITDISFCYLKNSNLGCKKLQKDEKFSITSIDNDSINFKRLLSFNKIEQTSFGIKRFGDKTRKDDFIPSGTIIKPKNNLSLTVVSKNKKEIFIL